MLDVLSGFTTIWLIIGTGFLTGKIKLFDTAAQQTLSRLAFNVGLPPLLFTIVYDADLGNIFSSYIVIYALSALGAIALYLGIAAVAFPGSAAHRIVGSFGAAYLNANNIGISLAAYVLHDVTWAAPVVMFQNILLQPIMLAILESIKAREQGKKASIGRMLSMPFRNPLTIGVLLGVICNAVHLQLPSLLLDPIQKLGSMGLPAVLVAFGISLAYSQLPKADAGLAELIVVSAIKLIGQPLLAIGLAFAFGASPEATLAAAIFAGLPTAPNSFVFAMRYNESLELARNSVMVTTLASIGTLTAIAAILHLVL